MKKSVSPLFYYSYKHLQVDPETPIKPALALTFGSPEDAANPEFVAICFARTQIREAIDQVEVFCEEIEIVEVDENNVREILAKDPKTEKVSFSENNNPVPDLSEISNVEDYLKTLEESANDIELPYDDPEEMCFYFGEQALKVSDALREDNEMPVPRRLKGLKFKPLTIRRIYPDGKIELEPQF